MTLQHSPFQVMPPPSAEDRAALEESIIRHGVLTPVDYDEAGNILDGHTRVEICESLGLVDWPRFIRKGLDDAEKRTLARELNVARRHLTAAQKRELIEGQLRDTPSISSRAIAAMLGVNDKTVTKVRDRLIATAEIPQLETTEGRDGKERRRPIRTAFLPEAANVREFMSTAKDIRDRQREHSRAVRTDLIKAIAEKGTVTAGEMPVAAFPVIYADPPWEQEAYSDETGQDRGLSYPAMPLDDIKALCTGDRSPATRDAILLLWVTASRLKDGLDVMEAWGFTYKSHVVWDKVNIGLGRWVRDRHELLLIGTRGNFPGLIPGTQPHSLYSETKDRHSVKPTWFASQIDRLWPDLPKLELFQRKDSLHFADVRLNGTWSFWGFEAGSADGA